MQCLAECLHLTEYASSGGMSILDKMSLKNTQADDHKGGEHGGDHGERDDGATP
jgi:hypothetical protein